MAAIAIGLKIQRLSWVRESPWGKVHLLESTISDRFITRCGLQLREETRHGVIAQVVDFEAEDGCETCGLR